MQMVVIIYVPHPMPVGTFNAPTHYPLLTPCSRVLLEKLTGSQLVNECSALHGTRRFITAFTNACYLSLSRARSIQSMSPHLISWRSILILSFHLRTHYPYPSEMLRGAIRSGKLE